MYDLLKWWEIFELFHKLWGQSKDGVYDKIVWDEL